MRTRRLETVVLVAVIAGSSAACTPSWVTLAPAQRADAQPSIRTAELEVLPPEGRWVVETIAAEADWSFDRSHWAHLLDGLVEARAEGLRFCYVRRVAYGRGSGRRSPKTDCFAIRAFQPITEIAEAPHSLQMLFGRRIEATRDQVSMEKSWWYGVETLSGHGRARTIRIGGRSFASAEFVADYDETRVLAAGGSVLLAFVGRSLVVVWLPDASLDGSRERRRVVESLTPSRP